MSRSIEKASCVYLGCGYAVFLHPPAKLACVRRLNCRKLRKALLLALAHRRAHPAENEKSESGNGKPEHGNGLQNTVLIGGVQPL